MASEEIDFKVFLNHIKIGVFRCSTGSRARFIYANVLLCEMFGYSLDELPNLRVKDLFFDPLKFQAFVQRTTEEGSLKNFEVQLKGKKAKSVWCSVSATAVKNKKDKIVAFDVVVDNIALRKNFEKELIESKELFQTVFTNTAAAITVTDKDEKIVAWNPFTEKMLESTKKDLFNKPVRELYPPREWRRMRSFQIRRRGMRSDIETFIYKKDNTLLEVNVSITVLKDLEGKVIGSIGIIRDITSQKAAERKIRESENKIRVILDNSAAAISMTDDQERIISWNKYTENLLGMKKRDLYLKHISILYPQEEWLKIRAANIRKMGSKHHLETKIITKKGKVIDIDLSVNVLRDIKKRIIGSVGIMQDITEQKYAQQMLLEAKLAAEEANSTKTLFLANMSHEVRTPMNTVLGMIDLTLDTSLNEEQKENIIKQTQ